MFYTILFRFKHITSLENNICLLSFLCGSFAYHDFGISQIPRVGGQSLRFRIDDAFLYDFDDVFTDKPFTPFRHSVGLRQQSLGVELTVRDFSGDRILGENVRTGNPMLRVKSPRRSTLRNNICVSITHVT